MNQEQALNVITQNATKPLCDYPLQICHLKHTHGLVEFSDDLHDEHPNLMYNPCPLYISGLVKSCLCSHEDYIFSCDCGIPEDVDIYSSTSLLYEGEIFICVNDDTILRFARDQVADECFTLLSSMLDELKTAYTLETFPCVYLRDDDVKQLMKDLRSDTDFSDFDKDRKHKILIESVPDGIYQDSGEEWKNFEDDGSLIFYEDKNEFARIYIEGFYEWSKEMRSNQANNLKHFHFDMNLVKRGREFANLIAKKLPDNFMVFYEYDDGESYHMGKIK